METPPPSGTRPAGQATTPRVCCPLTATTGPDLTTVNPFGGRDAVGAAACGPLDPSAAAAPTTASRETPASARAGASVLAFIVQELLHGDARRKSAGAWSPEATARSCAGNP